MNFLPKNKFILIGLIIVACGFVAVPVLYTAFNRPKTSRDESYSLDLVSGKTYPANKPTKLDFTVQDDSDKTFKDFDRSNPIPLMVTVIRKDRTSFQHLHPIFNHASGTFTVDPIVFPNDGEYQIYASFRTDKPDLKHKDERVNDTAYQDVLVGHPKPYRPQPLHAEQLSSSVDGYDTSLSSATLLAGSPNRLVAKISQNGQPFKGLHDFKGSLGRITAFGPSLELVAVNAIPVDASEQTGLIVFNVNFPVGGFYKLYMEVQVDKKVSTFEYIVKVRQ